MVNRHALLFLLLGIISISLVGPVSASNMSTAPSVKIDAPTYVTQNIPFSVTAFTFNYDGELTNCTNGDSNPGARLYVKDQIDGSMIYNFQLMNLLDTGKYSFNISVPKQTTYTIYSSCVMDHVPYFSNPKVITSQDIPINPNILQLNECRHLKLGYYNKHLVFDKQMGCFDPDEI